MAGYNTGDDENGEQYITVGEAQALGANFGAFMRPGGGAAVVPRPAAARLSPNVLQLSRNNVQPRVAPQVLQSIQRAMPGITEPQAIALIRRELEAFGMQIQQEWSNRYPYGDIPPKPVDGEAMFPMGLGVATLTSVNGGVSVLTAQPQRAFRGERLITSITRSAGAAGIGVVITDFSIGDYKQLVGGGSLPVDVFASDAFGVRLMLDGSIPGVLYRLNIAALAPIPVGESIAISGAVIGRAGEAPQR